MYLLHSWVLSRLLLHHLSSGVSLVTCLAIGSCGDVGLASLGTSAHLLADRHALLGVRGSRLTGDGTGIHSRADGRLAGGSLLSHRWRSRHGLESTSWLSSRSDCCLPSWIASHGWHVVRSKVCPLGLWHCWYKVSSTAWLEHLAYLSNLLSLKKTYHNIIQIHLNKY